MKQHFLTCINGGYFMTLSVCTCKPQAFYELLTLQKISSRAGHSTRSGKWQGWTLCGSIPLFCKIPGNTQVVLQVIHKVFMMIATKSHKYQLFSVTISNESETLISTAETIWASNSQQWELWGQTAQTARHLHFRNFPIENKLLLQIVNQGHTSSI